MGQIQKEFSSIQNSMLFSYIFTKIVQNTAVLFSNIYNAKYIVLSIALLIHWSLLLTVYMTKLKTIRIRFRVSRDSNNFACFII